MIDLKRIRAVALDIAGAAQSYERQDDLSEFIWHLLERHYRIFLFTTAQDDDLSQEDFAHPRLTFLRDELPPSRALLEAHPGLRAAETLWVTDDAALQEWLHEAGLAFMYLQHGEAPPPGGQHLTRLSELSALLRPTELLLHDLTAMVADARRFRPQGALLVGIGGPPMSGFQQFALDLRAELQEAGQPLVDLLDLTHLLPSCEVLLEQGPQAAAPWVSPAAGRWLREAVLAPLRAGRAVYVERMPAELPADFGAHFPLYFSETAVVLAFAELLFTPELAEALDLALLLEVAPEEVTRRLYEIPTGERFDARFTQQYLSREGRIYEDYLARNRVRERASVRIDANREGAFFVEERAGGPLV